jgi:hypothetical protein
VYLRPEALRRALVADGFMYIPYEFQSEIAVPSGHYLVAAYAELRSGELLSNYHFYRRHEESGVWYHKPGFHYPVTNLDGSGKIIEDPQIADREYRKAFVGFFLAPQEGVKYDIVIRPLAKYARQETTVHLKI